MLFRSPVIANTRDEPNRTSLLRAANSRIMSGGYVPNLAADTRDMSRALSDLNKWDDLKRAIKRGEIESFGPKNDLIEKMLSRPNFLEKLKSHPVKGHDIGTTEQLETALKGTGKSNEDVRAQYREHNEKIIKDLHEESRQNAKINEETKIASDLRRKQLNSQIKEEAMRRESVVIQSKVAGLQEKLANVGNFSLLTRSSKSITEKLLKESGHSGDAAVREAFAGSAATALQGRKQNLAVTNSLILGIAAPLAAGAIEASPMGKTAGGRYSSSIINGVGMGASLGGLTGNPIGIAAGAGIGGTIGAISSAINEPSFRREQTLAKKLKQADQRQSVIGNISSYVQNSAQLNDIISGGGSQYAIKAKQDQIEEDRKKIADDPELLAKFNEIDSNPSLSVEERQEALHSLTAQATQKNNAFKTKSAAVAITQKLEGASSKNTFLANHKNTINRAAIGA